MAILSFAELFDGRDGDSEVADGRRYVRRYRVLTDNPYDGPNTIKSALGIRYGDRYVGLSATENDQYSYIESIDAAQEDGDSLGWIVTVSYGPFDALTAGGGPTNNPLLMPMEVEWSYRNQEVVAQYDNNGTPITNTAGDPFDPPIVIDDPRPILTIVRNEAVFPWSLAYQYRTAVNSDTFGPVGPQMARVIQISGKYACHYSIGWYSIVTYEFEFNPPLGYRPMILNLGLRKISQASATLGQLVPITINGQPVGQPMLLTKAGYLAKPTDQPYFVQPQIYPELPFAAFNFDPIAIGGQRSGRNTQYGPNGGAGSPGSGGPTGG
jgi:hypothetical protein